MIAYVVCEYGVDEMYILGVFSTREKADAYITRVPSKFGVVRDIEEYEMDGDEQ